MGTPEQLLEVLPFRQFKMRFLVLDDPDSITGMGATRMLKQVLNVIPGRGLLHVPSLLNFSHCYIIDDFEIVLKVLLLQDVRWSHAKAGFCSSEPRHTLLFSSSSNANMQSIANFTLKANPVENIPSDWQMMEPDERVQQQQQVTQPEHVPNNLEQGISV